MPRTEPPATAHHHLLHSHSEMTRQLEEMVAHAFALRSASEDQREILEDLLRYAEEFSAEMMAHMAEEEGEIFPTYRHVLSPAGQAMLHRVQAQHVELEEAMTMLMKYLYAANDEDCPDDDLLECIYVRARLLKYSFTVHSAEEREFFKELVRILEGAE